MHRHGAWSKASGNWELWGTIIDTSSTARDLFQTHHWNFLRHPRFYHLDFHFDMTLNLHSSNLNDISDTRTHIQAPHLQSQPAHEIPIRPYAAPPITTRNTSRPPPGDYMGIPPSESHPPTYHHPHFRLRCLPNRVLTQRFTISPNWWADMKMASTTSCSYPDGNFAVIVPPLLVPFGNRDICLIGDG